MYFSRRTRKRALLRYRAAFSGVFAVSAMLPAHAAETRYTDPEHGYSFAPPAGWTANRQLVPHYVVFVEPNKKRSEEAVTIGFYGGPTSNLTLEQYVKAARDSNAKEKGIKVLDEKAATLGGEKAHVWRMRVQVPGYDLHENRQFFALHDNQATVITMTGTPATVKKYEGAFAKLIASFQWGKPVRPNPAAPKAAVPNAKPAAPKKSAK